MSGAKPSHGTATLLYGCLLAIVLLMAVEAVVGIHPKQKNLREATSNKNLDLGLHENNDAQFYRIRRQNHNPRTFSMNGPSIRQIGPLLEQLSGKIRSLESKLMRHEYREAQVADFTAKTLNALTADHSQSKANLERMAKQMAVVEERVMATISLVSTSDERQRNILGKLSEGLDRLLLASTEPSLGRSPNDVPNISQEMVALTMKTNMDMGRDVQNIARKVSVLNDEQEQRMRGVMTEVRQLNDAMSKQLGLVSSSQDTLLEAVHTCAAATAGRSTGNSVNTEACDQLKTEMAGRLELLTQMQQGQGLMIQDFKENTENAMKFQKAGLHAILGEIRQEGSFNNGSFTTILEGLKELELTSHQELGGLHVSLNTVLEESNSLIQKRIDEMENFVRDGHTNIMGALDDTASMNDNLQMTVSDNYELLSKEISGLNKIEQVMINTADAVLDTKRSIEFGIQQVILELSEIVSQSGSTINTTLSNQISNISFDILKNQTSALTNMTRRMESEISQVWRQIGIMYQQVEQSINMLDNLQDTTDQHMNVSLSRVGSMDGTVGEINGKVADVEDNLNYLLGRLSLVVSEFGHMKAGVSNELDKLRNMAHEVQIPNGEDNDKLKYNINRKRHIIEDDGYY